MGTYDVAVFGAYGHTGRFVVAELRERGLGVLAVGRDEAKLRGLPWPDLDIRQASVDDPASLDRAFAGADAVINAAGPFADTAAPVIEAALRAGVPYLDVAAELEANLDTFAQFGDRATGATVIPAMAFFGGLGDLMVTAAMGDWTSADEAHVAYGLSSWHPTEGTRAAGKVSRERRDGKRIRFSGGRIEHRDDVLPALDWDFPAPLGTRAVLGEFTMADVVTVPSHLDIPEVTTYMTVNAAREVVTPETPAPPADGPSAQEFMVDVVVRSGGGQRRIVAQGQDIYAITAPLVVEAVQRVLDGRTKATGVVSAGAVFDAADFLAALAPRVTVEGPVVS
ncbi:saccharopine dehydrogenase family protein [Amycolatopsis decaplanina]|uniref:Saccharopine dehydrogenase n=1 Tax=Amycolatopsis decaplanina DSM 44594 TaxID=1284240 RepID=M2ZSZ2_9PSEU|nr:NAD(P)H-binding protein [Amycolatopsis decaplanina]EME63464.1 saccharopine dehydrogenase [Amycolatopsis decaplanina DSM 44594]